MMQNFLLPPALSNYEQAQKAKLLHYMLLAVFGGSLIIATGNFLNGWLFETVFLYSLSTICLIGLFLNHKNYFLISATIFCSALFISLGLLLFHGAGLYDGSVVAYPILILCVTFLFGKKLGVFVSTLFSILSLITIYFLQIYGFFISDYPASLFRLISLSLIYIAVALVTWVIHDTWQTNLKLLGESYDLTLLGWAKALEFRDVETAGHSQRVVKLAIALAEKLNLSKEEITQIQRGAMLHDIGKMALPDSILLKPGPLDEDETKLMRQHPMMAVSLISDIPFLHNTVSIPRYHHERWDGTGYPDQLIGEDIPISARIFTIIDHWDALSSDRPYRKAWTQEQVITYIQENTGTIYDPKIAVVFLNLVQNNNLFNK